MDREAIKRAQEHLGKLLEQQMVRVDKMKREADWLDFSKLPKIQIGVEGGDGIGPYIAEEAVKVLKALLKDEVSKGRVEFVTVNNLTIEYRAKNNAAIPADVLEEIKKYPVHLKGPTTTPRKGDPWPNIESCNVAMRKELDLFANVRPVRIPRDGIDWIFFRENTEGAYALGSQGTMVGENIALDFTLDTVQGNDRIIRLAFEHAKKNNRKRVTAVTKANVIKTTDGLFLQMFYNMAKEYPGIEADDWYIDIMTAKLVDQKRRRDFQVLVLPNLYGDILTDEAAEFQGGVGTAGSANIGKQYAMFEAIHGSAPRMVTEGRAKYADPCSMIRAGALMLNHIGFTDHARKLEMALDITGQYEKKLVMTGRNTGATGEEFGRYLLDWIGNPKLEESWKKHATA